jgi:dihydropteroate synthase
MTLRFSAEPLVMGIVNVTPDSFSDGGHFLDPAAAVRHGLNLVRQGADVLDVGGESTRPCATPVDTDEELQRVMPVLRELCRSAGVPVSVDTSKAAVARAALEAGAEIINDVTGLEADEEMLPLAAASEAGVCAMHMQGTPATMQNCPTYTDVVEDVAAYLQQRRDALLEAGVDASRICLDPGIGFGKTVEHNLALLSRCRRLLNLGCPVLVGHSRKGFLGHILGDRETDRTAATIGVAMSLAAQGVHVLRVHDVAPVKQALRLFVATGGTTYPLPS